MVCVCVCVCVFVEMWLLDRQRRRELFSLFCIGGQLINLMLFPPFCFALFRDPERVVDGVRALPVSHIRQLP